MSRSDIPESDISKSLTDLENDVAQALDTAASALNVMDGLDGDAVNRSVLMWKSFVGQVEALRSNLTTMVASCPKPTEYNNTELYLAYADLLSASKQASLIHKHLQDLEKFIYKS
ncbi:hypothetical protein BVRB_037530 [Beta vulgaris subsp. vulgaris]|uniref:Mediator of RNA polymerase II transcription subunit 11 n=1 Tax=Beta vulgaris subsp. vulgaris TaxID=3555 RepID=A0A0J8BHU3_BETVV|nr:hypothetical protein BVRB_037530 [Beta vulgaris subsp. vulgaris]